MIDKGINNNLDSDSNSQSNWVPAFKGSCFKYFGQFIV